MMNFVDWLTEHLSKEDGIKWDKKDAISFVKDMHANLLSEDPDPSEGRHYGDCTNENLACYICIYQNWLDKYEEYCRNEANKKK